MPDIIQYKVVQEVGDKYRTFGIFLLNDETGAHVETMKQDEMNNAEDIIHRILREWLRGGGENPVSWETLISVLKKCELNQLARSIEAKLCM